MALLRCDAHALDFTLDDEYPVAVEPVGYPETAVVCPVGDGDHADPALCVLTGGEYDRYEDGECVFEIEESAVSVRVVEPPTMRLKSPVDDVAEAAAELTDEELTAAVDGVLEDSDEIVEAARRDTDDEDGDGDGGVDPV